MEKKNEDYFEDFCTECLESAVTEYLRRVSHHDLRALKARISLLLEGPCLTEECREACNGN